ncbi:MAG: SDR family NAD(P)-dependent oxidoreductase, partial [Planctomycetota bacterium]
MEFENKVALVTGAAGSIGKGIALRLCEQGARVFITDLDQTKIDQCCAEIDAGGKLCKGLAADVTDQEQVAKVAQAALSEFGGKIDILVNVAGVVAQG